MSLTQEEWRLMRHFLACRAGHRCEVCGVVLGPGEEGTAHHRLMLSAGGWDALEVLLLLCGGRLGGVRGCHGLVHANPAWAYEHGLLLRRGQNPADVPVVLYTGWRRRLDPFGPSYLPPVSGPLFVPPPLSVLAGGMRAV